MKATSVSIMSDSKAPKEIGFGVTNKEVFRIIENKIAIHYQMMPKQFFNTSRKIGICEARQMVQYFMRKHTTYSLSEIGYYTGGLDHADVVHNVRKIQNLCDVYPMFKIITDNLNQSILLEVNNLIKEAMAI